MDEVSGTRRDSVGAEHLTDINTVAQGTGTNLGAAQFVKANNESLQIAADSVVNTGDVDWTWNFWLKWTVDPVTQGWPIAISKDSAGLNNAEFVLGWDAGVSPAKFCFNVFSGGAAGFRTEIARVYTPTVTGTVGVWYMFTLDHSATTNTIGVRINGGTRTSAATSGACGVTNIPLFISGRADGWYIDGLIDEVGYWKRSLTDAEATQLYNSGAGLTWPFTALTQGLVSYWQLEEASGSRADSIGANTLTDNNTVTGNPGKVNNAAQFTAANSEWLSIVDNAALSVGALSFTVAAWVYLDTKPSQAYLVSKFDGTAAGAEYLLYYASGSDRFTFLSGNAVNLYVATANSFGSPATSTWYFLVAWYDIGAATVNIQVNNGTVDSASFASGTPVDTGTAFNVGRGGVASPQYHDGRIDEVGFWKRVLTATERTQLYNAGAGLAWPLNPPPTTFLAGVMAA